VRVRATKPNKSKTISGPVHFDTRSPGRHDVVILRARSSNTRIVLIIGDLSIVWLAAS
jgi:hypothetical protein